MTPSLYAAAFVLADTSSEAKKAGPLALAVILLLSVATYFLLRSMSRHLRKVRDEFPADVPAPGPPDAGDDPTQR